MSPSEFESTSNGKKAKTLSHQGKIQSSFLDLDDVPEIVEDMNEEIMTENDKATISQLSLHFTLHSIIYNFRLSPVFTVFHFMELNAAANRFFMALSLAFVVLVALSTHKPGE